MRPLLTDLYPLPRSLTGDGVRATLQRLHADLPLTVHEVPSGTPVLDWVVPDEWNVRAAWIRDAAGAPVVDWADHTLHLVGYSVPVRRRMTWAELVPHLHTLPAQPDLIPYRTGYYADTWGFCLPHRQFEALAAEGPDAEYDVCIDSTKAPGALTFGEYVLPGETPDEVLLSAHICHPSLANDNLAGIAVAVALAQRLAAQPRRRYTYRFVFAPGTIGAIVWLALRANVVPRLRHGLILANLGDRGPFTYKQSRPGTLAPGSACIDRVVAYHLGQRGLAERVRPFTPYGYDERQYGSPGYNLPVGCLTRTPYGEYPEYHTSGDNLALVSDAALADALALLTEVVGTLEGNRRYRNRLPHGEPQLGRRGLYSAIGGHPHAPLLQQALLWVLNLSDGAHDLLAIAERAGLPFAVVAEAANRLLDAALLDEVQP